MTAIKICTIVLLVSLTFGAGLGINREHFLSVLKNYGLIGRALLANIVIVPLLGVVVVALFHLPEFVAVGILLMAIAPGVPFVLQAAGRSRGGSQGLAVVLVVVLQAVSVITVPLTLLWVLSDDEKAHIPMGSFVLKLVLFQILPIVVGYIVGQRAPSVAKKLERPLLLIFLLSAIAVVALLGSKIGDAFAEIYGSGGLLASLLLVVLSTAIGWLLAGKYPAYRRTLAIGTTLRNIGLASVVATANFPGTSAPEAVMTYLVIQFAVATIVGIYFQRSAKAEGALA